MREQMSRHAQKRLQQRGMHCPDISLVLTVGTRVDEETFFLRCKDADEEIRALKARIRSLERLRNTKVVVAGDTIVTVYKAKVAEQQRMKRSGVSLAG